MPATLWTKVTPHQVDISTKTILTGPKAGTDYFAVNPKGNVPAIVLESGTLLNENASTLQWIADNAVTSVGPKAGTKERYNSIFVIQASNFIRFRLKLQTKLSFVSSELHGVIHDLFNPDNTAPVREYLADKLNVKLRYTNDVEFADNRKFWVGQEYSVADSYLYFILSVVGFVGINLTKFPALKIYLDGLNALPFIKEAQELMEKQANMKSSDSTQIKQKSTPVLARKNPFQRLFFLFFQFWKRRAVSK
ncbi:UNVERIFIED_CONTAM: hypothetical protein HDU68_002524 [Siphonaria sp. JEL0065]|nr:hypothetical protein HDU68_002524 [Siphonaria sp. JEL0065]